jgi:hypothetical protein
MAFILDDLGFEASGIDISNVAITQVNKNIKFDVGDLFKDKPIKKYDFISDSSCLNCIFFDEERTDFYNYVRASLNSSDSSFFLHTMISSNKMSDITNRPYLFLDGFFPWSSCKAQWDIKWYDLTEKQSFLIEEFLEKKN